jgi:hypothetical protein
VFEHGRPISLGPGRHTERNVVVASARNTDPIEAFLPFDVHVRYRSVNRVWYGTRLTLEYSAHGDTLAYVWGSQYLGRIDLPSSFDPSASLRPA